MMKHCHVLGILPARGGSKGIPGKNLRHLCGRPLIGWAAEAIVKAPSVSRSICSTDDDEIAIVATQYGLDIPFIRPSYLAGDTTPVVDVVLHALDQLDSPSDPYTHVVLVQATTPTVTVNDVEAAIQLARHENADSVISGFQAGMHHPALMFALDEQGCVKWLLEGGGHSRRRQDLPSVFIRTGLLYLTSVTVLRSRRSLYGERIFALVVDERRAITIDEENDFLRAQAIMGDALICPR